MTEFSGGDMPLPRPLIVNPVVKYELVINEEPDGTWYTIKGIRADGRTRVGKRSDTKPGAMYLWNKSVEKENKSYCRRRDFALKFGKLKQITTSQNRKDRK